ncbi:MAG: CBS domain-containing protein [Chloroflexi bacterium]|jgi:signal-transduction protein with cAMP-binding, CBS, and nucleotidyltransferase domain|nr:CBS domain-containing protein [Chloroflexota bacterium]
MQLSVKDWMKELIVYIDPESMVSEALEKMRHRYISSLIVSKSDTNPEYGIVTSIDIVDKIVAQQRDPSKTKVREIMNSPLITVEAHMSLPECAAKMKEARVHHLPVVNEKHEIIGMISSTDFLLVAEGMGKGFSERALS